MNPMLNHPGRQSGLSMIEVLVTLVILMVGLLGLAGLQMQGLRSEMESYQRVQALILLQDMAGRINANRRNAASYVANNIGTGAAAVCTALSGQLRDTCEWSNALQGTGETSSTAASVGAMIGGRGCITYAAGTEFTNPTTGAVVAGTGLYTISVVWQGLGRTFAPTTDLCGQGQYGDEALRRVVSLAIRTADLTAP